MKFFKSQKFKSSILILFLLFLYIFISAQQYVFAVSGNLSDAVFRLHVIANSNSDEDQALKLKVRDSLLEYMNKIALNCSTKEDAISLALENKDIFESIARETIVENGYNYDVKISINNFYFPTKNYGDITLPAGMYDALRVEIGEAKGQNWWCVMFPSLCFVDISSGIVNDDAKESLEQNLSEESYTIISNKEKSNIKFKFKLIEFFAENNIFKIAQNND